MTAGWRTERKQVENLSCRTGLICSGQIWTLRVSRRIVSTSCISPQTQFTGVNSATRTTRCRTCPVFSVPNLRLSFGYIVQSGGPEHEVTTSPSLSAILLQVQHALNVRNNQSRSFEVLLQHQVTMITCKTKTTEVIHTISCILLGLFNATLRQ